MYLNNGGNCIINNNFTNSNHCILIYEDFINNHDIILNKLEVFFKEEYSLELKNKIKSKLDIKSVKKFINERKYDNFDEFDNYTHFHGRHISKYNVTTDYKIILNKKQLSILKQNISLTKIIEKYYKE